MNTIKLQFKLVNDAPADDNSDLEMLGPPHAVCFQSASFKCCGQSVELLEDYGRAYLAMEQLLPQASRAMNGAESLPLLDIAPAPTEGSWGFTGAGAGANVAADKALHRRNQDIAKRGDGEAAAQCRAVERRDHRLR